MPVVDTVTPLGQSITRLAEPNLSPPGLGSPTRIAGEIIPPAVPDVISPVPSPIAPVVDTATPPSFDRVSASLIDAVVMSSVPTVLPASAVTPVLDTVLAPLDGGVATPVVSVDSLVPGVVPRQVADVVDPVARSTALVPGVDAPLASGSGALARNGAAQSTGSEPVVTADAGRVVAGANGDARDVPSGTSDAGGQASALNGRTASPPASTSTAGDATRAASTAGSRATPVLLTPRVAADDNHPASREPATRTPFELPASRPAQVSTPFSTTPADGRTDPAGSPSHTADPGMPDGALRDGAPTGVIGSAGSGTTGVSSTAPMAAMVLVSFAFGIAGLFLAFRLPPAIWRPGPFLSLAERPG
jgi:hypothetical protein